jgi:hypothetical protein
MDMLNKLKPPPAPAHRFNKPNKVRLSGVFSSVLYSIAVLCVFIQQAAESLFALVMCAVLCSTFYILDIHVHNT